MCELFALSSLHPATATFSLGEFARHGGITGPHKDGWGIAFYQGRDARIVRDSSPAAESPYLEFIQKNRFTSHIIMAHIRLATKGVQGFQNCQPFSRELGGRLHLFAHNGDLENISTLETPDSCFHPIGETDSELAFCHLMNRMSTLWLHSPTPSMEEKLAIIDTFAATIRPMGPANFLYSDGDYLFIHGHKRTQPGTKIVQPPGLHFLQRTCALPEQARQFPGVNLDYGVKPQEVTLVASVPLSEENWIPLDEGEILILKAGSVLRRVRNHLRKG